MFNVMSLKIFIYSIWNLGTQFVFYLLLIYLQNVMPTWT